VKYRSRSEIIGVILQTANRGATKTRIMYGAYLSSSQVTEYLAFMQSKELLMYEEGTHLYRLTEKGLHFMGTLEEINDMICLTNDDSSDQVASVDKKASKEALTPRQW
jgi:predicted transcriptional regulator